MKIDDYVKMKLKLKHDEMQYLYNLEPKNSNIIKRINSKLKLFETTFLKRISHAHVQHS